MKKIGEVSADFLMHGANETDLMKWSVPNGAVVVGLANLLLVLEHCRRFDVVVTTENAVLHRKIRIIVSHVVEEVRQIRGCVVNDSHYVIGVPVFILTKDNLQSTIQQDS